MNRIVGLETEYGCLSLLPPGATSAVERVRDWIFSHRNLGLIDVHHRDWDEPSGNGGFLFNGGRLYLDMGHLEYCTPECLSLADLLRYDQAGDALIIRALEELKLDREVSFVRNNIDHYTGATFGCHENYLVRRSAPLNEANVLSLLAFLTLRVLYVGAGRVGSIVAQELRGQVTRMGADDLFQISQRADYINNDLYEWVQFNRAIINTRDEPLGDPRKYRRLHLLHGDTSVLPTTLLLKLGTTALVLDLLEINKLPKVALADAVTTLRELSRQTSGPWRIMLADRQTADAVEVLAGYCDAARREFRGRDQETDALLEIWAGTLTALQTEPAALVGQVDWITKKWLFEQFKEQEGITWADPWLKSQDIEFHKVDPTGSLALSLAQTPAPWQLEKAAVAEAMFQPPINTRARARSTLMQWLEQHDARYHVDWEILGVEGGDPLTLLNPFDPDPPEARVWQTGIAEVLKTLPGRKETGEARIGAAGSGVSRRPARG